MCDLTAESVVTPNDVQALAYRASQLYGSYSRGLDFQQVAWEVFKEATRLGLVDPDEAQPEFCAALPPAVTQNMLGLVWDRAVDNLAYTAPELYAATQAQARQFCFARD